ncbi:MAG TPA: elongation factor 4 [Elusimicrobia bacterium]|nr:MAG: elongation factor 4 [Elusimicrobia bacterium RIFOXYA12_FULL_49_49]OGS08549.1 MAG: elongation factor 4 [Elusimicrobia bacterium RIFOXYA1_FULL_47_7]OGS15576.1 MAG: elongation factor 4 [Elusimicrobia bacterium RIFOXYA2_FULL_47_53]OGS26868.1 MAG: elongation factor 4 [Elusimicrobia bacterium RIFOXYB12_FULL_50_12]OGS30675.1 MAG: elongation factor 4 [Elusimicrobia bacterium RIFOXYB2_FULL_46_23]HBU68865.1 elongation factor 4 [Elusimicrobiota bacterium]
MQIRNFCIIAHIDHGKSTLADRLLEYTGTISKREMKEQILDGMDLERERGITIKAKAIKMNYRAENGEEYILNLIDTPGHVDFTYEVSRALAACEGALLIVDASQGVEAQTLANTYLARQSKLKIIPVINKIDLSTADIESAKEQIREGLDITDEPILVSAKEGKGIPEIVERIISDVPPPEVKSDEPLSALVFDSFYDTYRGAIILVRVLEGEIRPKMKIKFVSSGRPYEVIETGYMKLKTMPSQSVPAGEVGYVVAGIKDIHDIRIGDTITELSRPTARPHPGYKEIKPFVFAGLYPVNSSDYDNLKTALGKLHLSDSSLFYGPETSTALGFGFRCGFLGSLHLEIVKERLEREFNLNLLVTAPNVIYKVQTHKGTAEIDNPAKFPNYGDIIEIQEPYVLATIICPSEFLGQILELCQKKRGTQILLRYIDMKRVIVKYELPLAEIIVGFYDSLKSVSKGYASFDYEHIDTRPGDLVKLEILINQEVVDAFSVIIHKDKASMTAHFLAEKLRGIIPRQMFEIPIQARVNNKVIVRENISAMRKDVLAKCYGGDISRKRKLLEKQKEGKKRMRQFGRVEIPPEAFVAVLKISE